MAPKHQKEAPVSPFAPDERVLCFHMSLLYEAKILDVQPLPASSPADGGGTGAASSSSSASSAAANSNEARWQYKIHYKGWKSTWDDWVPQDRVRKFTDENKQVAAQLLVHWKEQQSGGKGPKGASGGGKKSVGGAGARGGGGAGGGPPTGSDQGSARGSEERGTAGASGLSGGGPFAMAQSGRGGQRNRMKEFDLEQEDTFHNRPSIKIPVPDHIKAFLVDDWENVTKNCQLVPTPHPHPVDEILDDYLSQERLNRIEGSASVEVLEETIAGLREYFDKSLGRILLYRFERPQFIEMHQMWAEESDSKHKSASSTYGAEHLARLLVTLPELIAQTNMDQQSVNRLRDEIVNFVNWLGRNVTKYFVSEYESPTQEYINQARGT